ncbi:MAG: ribonuclease HI [Deltaproteobacteria bacterium]|jgi:ribonuclease HI|nr:ribonuclease HI [Deltaproteobacteria bacterium]
MSKFITIYADGGGAGSKTAGSGCVIQINDEQVSLIKLVGFLGKATNNEAEITAVLMGLAYIRYLNQELIRRTVWEKQIPLFEEGSQRETLTEGSIYEVRVVSDSEYTLKSATCYISTWLKNGWKTAAKEPVKNQGLWKIYLKLAYKLNITAEHVKGHSGHLFNEACDQASTWSRLNGKTDKSTQFVKIPNNPIGEDWILIDLENFLGYAREGQIKQAVQQLESLVSLYPN